MKKLANLVVLFVVVFSSVFLAFGQAKSDAKALELLRQAREAIGGEAAINAVQSLSMKGKLHKNLAMMGRTESIDGNIESAFILPNQFFKKLELISRNADGTAGTGTKTEMKVLVRADKNVVVASNDANKSVFTVEDQKIPASGAVKVEKSISAHAERSTNDFANQMIGLLLSVPAGFDANYSYLGESSVDGTSSEILGVTGTNALDVKVYLDKSTHLPVGLSFLGHKAPNVVVFKHSSDGAPAPTGNVTIVRSGTPTSEAGTKQVIVNAEKVIIIGKDADQTQSQAPLSNEDLMRIQKQTESADTKIADIEITLKFSDYRSVNGLLLPFRTIQTRGGQPDEETTVESYEINVPNIAEKFKKETGNIVVKRIVENK